MADRLRILHLEDNAMDAELVAEALASDGLVADVIRAMSRPEFLKAVDDGSYDAILSDYALPGFDGISAQAIALARHPRVPFIFVSGTMGEEVAIDCLKMGATDYVLKHRLSRLAPALRRALQESHHRREHDAAEAEIRRLNEALQVALGQANAFLDSIVENLPDLLFVKDATELRYVRLNRLSEEVLGVARGELVGRRAADVFPREIADTIERHDRRTLEGLRVIDLPEEIVPTRQRGPRVFQSKRIPILGPDGTPAYLLDISRDITEQRNAQENARLSKLEAERANRAKSEFLSRMSHDLRTPLNAVLGFAQVLDLERLPRDQADSVRQILMGGEHLLELINEVLDISRIESGHLSLSPEPVDLAAVVHHVVDLLRPLAAPQDIKLTVVPTPPGQFVLADRQRLKQVLINLASNAVKYNVKGGDVTVRTERDEARRSRIIIEDTGPGIPADKQALLFQPFERLGAENSAIEGTGLGLAVAKGLVEAMRGTIGLRSQAGRGCTFWVELPSCDAPATAAVPVEPQDAPAAGQAGAGTILYIEDNFSNVRLLQRLMGRRAAVRLLTEPRGEDGIARANDVRPDLILLDLHLPDMPGEEVLTRLRADPRTRDLPVAVLSADAMPAQRQRLMAAGAIAYLSKPIDVRQLLQLIDDRLGDRRQEPTP